jgi:hypothetical protein
MHHTLSFSSSAAECAAWSRRRMQLFQQLPLTWYDTHIGNDAPLRTTLGGIPALAIASAIRDWFNAEMYGSKMGFTVRLVTWARGSVAVVVPATTVGAVMVDAVTMDASVVVERMMLGTATAVGALVAALYRSGMSGIMPILLWLRCESTSLNTGTFAVCPICRVDRKYVDKCSCT